MNMIIKNKKGFTLIELLVVISIIALLSSVVLAALTSARQKAQMSKVKSEMSEFVKALEIYRTTYGTYPSSTGGSCTGAYTQTCENGLFTTVINAELTTKKLFSGDLYNKTLKSIPRLLSVNLYYNSGNLISFESDLEGENSNATLTCNGKKPTEYLMIVTASDTAGIVDLKSSYWSKILYGGTWDGATYCAGN